jgi:hypothetical protein
MVNIREQFIIIICGTETDLEVELNIHLQYINKKNYC